MDLIVERLPGRRKPWVSSPALHTPDVVHICPLGTLEVEAGGSEVHSHLQQRSEDRLETHETVSEENSVEACHVFSA